MATNTKQKETISKAFKEAEKAALAASDAAVPVEDNGKLDMVDTDGKMLMCNFTLHKKPGAADPLSIVVNEGGASGFQGFLKRGEKVKVPWFVVLHLQNNIERRFTKSKDDQGKNIIIAEDVPAESFTYSPINPSPNNPPWL